MGFSSFPLLKRVNDLHHKSHNYNSFQNSDLLYDLHCRVCEIQLFYLRANARYVVFHVADVERPICCARQANDIDEDVSNLAPLLFSSSSLRNCLLRFSYYLEYKLSLKHFCILVYEVRSKIFRTGAAMYTAVVVARSTGTWQDYHV